MRSFIKHIFFIRFFGEAQRFLENPPHIITIKFSLKIENGASDDSFLDYFSNLSLMVKIILIKNVYFPAVLKMQLHCNSLIFLCYFD